MAIGMFCDDNHKLGRARSAAASLNLVPEGTLKAPPTTKFKTLFPFLRKRIKSFVSPTTCTQKNIPMNF